MYCSARRLNPVELMWGYAKTNPLANFAPLGLDDLVMQAQLATFAMGDDESLLHAEIPFTGGRAAWDAFGADVVL